jgi:NADPH2:quinone reductase
MNTHVAKRDVLEEMARDLFEVVSSGKVKIPVHNRYKLSEARKALEALEGRETTGAYLFIH